MKNWTEKRKLTFAVCFVLFCWGSAFSGIKMALESFSPFHLAFCRFVISSVVLFSLTFFKKIRRPERREWPWLVISGLVGISTYHIALNFGQQTISPGTASFLINCSPIFTALLSTLFFKQVLSDQAWVGILVSFFGVSLISLSRPGGISFEPAAVLILLAALSTAVYAILQKAKLSRLNGFEFAVYTVWIGTLGLLFFSPGSLDELRNASSRSLVATVYLGIFPGGLSYIAWAYAITKLPAFRVVSFMYFIPLIAILVAFLFFRELPTGMAVLGGVIALSGVALLHSARKRPEVPISE